MVGTESEAPMAIEATGGQTRFHSPLLSLPAELREMIWKFTFIQAESSADLALLLSCRQIYFEAAVLAFENATFRLDPSFWEARQFAHWRRPTMRSETQIAFIPTLKYLLTAERRRAIRSVAIDFDNTGEHISLWPERMLDRLQYYDIRPKRLVINHTNPVSAAELWPRRMGYPAKPCDRINYPYLTRLEVKMQTPSCLPPMLKSLLRHCLDYAISIDTENFEHVYQSIGDQHRAELSLTSLRRREPKVLCVELSFRAPGELAGPLIDEQYASVAESISVLRAYIHQFVALKDRYSHGQMPECSSLSN